jgi:DNA-binding transcriptional ArsR family regulator
MIPVGLTDLVTAIPPTWITELDTLETVTPSHRVQRYMLEYLVRWAAAEEIEDYDEASAAMRQVTLDAAINQVIETSGLEPAVDLDPTEQLIDLELRLHDQLAVQSGLYPPSDARVLKQERSEITAAVQVLLGGRLHGRFWQWMDRIYHQAYLPWRTKHLDSMIQLEQTAIDGLGGREGTGPPELGWLPRDNILIAIPAVSKASEAEELEIVFWAEPFGLSSAIWLAPGTFTTSFSALGIDHDYSTTIRDDLTSKLKALSDPTRMSILRMIRMFDADNTQIGGYLEVSRPAVSAHAKILADNGFINTTHDGRHARHAFHPNAVRQLCDELLHYLDVRAEDPDE